MLRSMKDMQGYTLGALDGEIGRCNDFLFDDRAWVVRYIRLNSDQIKESPEYDPRQPVNRELETILYDYYGRPYYW